MRWTDGVIRDVLPNGLTLLAQRDTSAPVVAVVTHVRAGYFDEPDEWVGIAHVLEHMFFKGTATQGPGVLARETQLLGGYLNAATSYDKTVYYAVVPSAGRGLARAVALQADALRHAALDPDELRRELEVVIQEAKRKLDSPPAVTGETLYELLFRVHRMRRWRIGTEAGLRRITAADLRAYYESRYVPGRIIVTLVGDLDPEDALAVARQAYGDWQRPPVPVPPGPTEPDGGDPRLRVLRGDVERPLAAVGWRTVGVRHPDTPALDVAATILGSGRGSWLSRAVRQPGLASMAGSSHYTPGEVGVFDVALTSDSDRVPAAVSRTVALAERLAAPGPDGGELDRVRALLACQWARRFESADGRATTLADFEAFGDYRLADAYYDALVGVDGAAVQRVASTYLGRDAACAVVYAPAESAIALDEARWPVADEGNLAPPAVPVRALARHPSSPASGDTRLAENLVHRALPGADILARRRPQSGLVSLGLHFPNLTTAESTATAGLSRLLTRVALRGAGGLTADEVAVAAESLGGGIAMSGDADTVGWTVTVRADSADAAVRLLRLVAAEPTLDPDHVAIERELQADDAAQVRDDMYRYPIERALALAFPGDAYGLPALGEPDVVRGFDAAGLRRWHDRLLSVRPVLVLVGDRSLEALLDAGATFGDWPARAELAPPVAAPWTAGRQIEERDRAQTAVAMAFPAPPAGADSRWALHVTGAILSGLAGRLFDELRERRALAYTVQSAPWLRRRAGAMIGYVATSPEREGEAREAMLAELGRVGQEPVTEAELERARRYAAGLVAIRRQQSAAVAGELVDAWVRGTIAGFDDEEPRRRAVTAAEVMATARAVFPAAQRAEFVVRGSGKTR